MVLDKMVPIEWYRLYLNSIQFLFHSFIPDIYVAPLKANYNSEALPTTAIDTVSEFTRLSATGNSK